MQGVLEHHMKIYRKGKHATKKKLQNQISGGWKDSEMKKYVHSSERNPIIWGEHQKSVINVFPNISVVSKRLRSEMKKVKKAFFKRAMNENARQQQQHEMKVYE